ncbi:restriction endonuclease subunit S [Niabella ginsenosidivorans]|nr:restriction endonuclease subunit S [Niabella ginsenosidivorans]
MSKNKKFIRSKAEGLIPELRFPEFVNEGKWQEKILEDVLEYERPDNYIVSDTNYHSEGIPVLTANKSFILGYTNEDFDIYKNLPAIIFDDFTVDSKFVDFPFKVKSSAIKILRPKNKDDLRFIYELISQIKFNAKEHKRYYISEYQKLKLSFPSITEQQKIASCLSSLDEVIIAHSQKLELLKDHKKGLMQNLFPQGGEKAPKYRFKEFEKDGQWEETVLENISSKIMVGIASAATHAYRKSGIILFRNQNIKEGYLDDKDIIFIDRDYEKEHKNKRLKAGDLLTARTGYPGTTCVVPEKHEGSQSFTTLITRPKSEIINSTFLCYYINSETGQVFFNSTKIGGGQKNVNAGSLAKMPIVYPSIKEQQKIASCLSALDELITAQAEKIEQLKLHKKGLMQGLFPKMND